MTQKIIDLSTYRNTSEDYMRKHLKTPGKYNLSFMTYKDYFNDDCINKVVDVVYTTPEESRMLVIIVKVDEDTYQDFYYNEGDGCFKILTFNDYDPEDVDDPDLLEEVGGMEKLHTMGASWIMEHIGSECPKEYADYKVIEDTFTEHNFFKDMFNPKAIY